MILSGKEIIKRLGGDIKIHPFSRTSVNPNSYNLRLHNELMVYTKQLDMAKDNPTERIIIPKKGLVLEPNTLYLGRTMEHTETHNLVPLLSGRSSVGRLGIHVHVTAGFGDVGFKGHWTLEIFCVQPVRIYPNVEICQVYYNTVSPNHDEYSSGKYQNNNDIQGSKFYEEL